MLPTVTVDVGTTSTKLCMFDADGALRASANHSTPTVRDAWGEIYDIDALQASIIIFTSSLTPELLNSIERVAFTGVGESGGLVNADLSLASPMILWHDHRGAALLESLSAAERSRIYGVTGLPVNANYGLSKIAWATHQLDGAVEGAQWLNIAEYLAAWMTGRRWSEHSLASRTMALDLRSGSWSPEVCALLGLDVDVFPQLRAASDGSPITAGIARSTRLPQNTMVHVAGHDHMVGGVGAGLRPGELLNSTGTTEGLLFLGDSPSTDSHSEASKLANGLSCGGSDFTLFASIPTGGSAFATLRSMLGMSQAALETCVDDAHRRYLADEVDLGRMPLVVPQFRGSPPPTKDSSARGIVAGISSDTSAEDVVFGCFLGLALQFRDVLELFQISPGSTKVIGPAGRNPLWTQLKADLLGTRLSVASTPEVVSMGAQALASQQQGDWTSCEPVEIIPDDARSAGLAAWSASIMPQWAALKEIR